MAAEIPNDLYWRLRPPTPTPADELCYCQCFGPLLLCDILGPNPIRCADCNGEVFPERIGYTPRVAEAIAAWQSIHSSLYRLWLASGDYEIWARDRLLDPAGEVNRLGYDIVAELNSMTHIEAYYWFFEDCDSESESGASNDCPKCSRPLTALANRGRRKCDSCMIVL